VHPTGLVDPSDPDAKVKFLAAEVRTSANTAIRCMLSKSFLYCVLVRASEFDTFRRWNWRRTFGFMRLAAQALRGTGALLLNGRGQRFCNELGHRDYVSNEMQKNQVLRAVCCVGVVVVDDDDDDDDGCRVSDRIATVLHLCCLFVCSQGPFRLLLNGKAASTIMWHCKHYMGNWE
jgi:hypothetical protein